MNIQCGSFEQGSNGWRPVNLAQHVNVFVQQGGDAYAGQHYLRAKTEQGGGSVAYDFQYGGPDSLGAFAWVRAAPGTGRFSGVFTLWHLEQNVNFGTSFTVGEAWTLVSNVLDPTAPGGDHFRLEFYMDTVGQFLDIDNVMVM